MDPTPVKEEANFDLDTLENNVTGNEQAVGPLIGIYAAEGELVFLYDADAGAVDAASVVTLRSAAGGVPAVPGQRLVCLGAAFVSGHPVQVAAYRPAGTPSQLDLSTLPLEHIDMAALIVNVFSALGIKQQAAALASAKAESGLDPHIISPPPEVSVGLFQFNTAPGAAGANFSVAQLQDPDFNAKQALAVVQGIPSFINAATLEDAVRSFVADFERPTNIPAAVTARQQIAGQILRS